jgi:hypothetical protein
MSLARTRDLGQEAQGVHGSEAALVFQYDGRPGVDLQLYRQEVYQSVGPADLLKPMERVLAASRPNLRAALTALSRAHVLEG